MVQAYKMLCMKVYLEVRVLAWPLRKDDTQIREAFQIFGPNQ